MVRILCDSTCDLSAELTERYGIVILPLHVSLGDKEYLDGVDIFPEDLYRWSDENKSTPKTSAVSMEDVAAVFGPILESGDEIVCFSISDSMSSTGSCMRMAVQDMNAEDKVTVIDSANLSTGIGLLLIEAAIMARQGRSREEIREWVEKLKPSVRASFVVDTLTYLYRGGRCTGVAALAGGMLRIHPKILVEQGAMTVGKKYRGKLNKVIMSYVKDMEEDLKKARKERVFITHSGVNDEIVEEVKDYLTKLNVFDEILVTRAGSVVSSHCGPGTLGVLFIAD